MEQRDVFAEKLRAELENPEAVYRPDLRWWLAEGLNTDQTLRKNVREIYDSGFGAAEFLAMPEPGADSSVYGWGSDEWTHDTRLIVEEAAKLGLGFSLTSGAHWANANLPDTYIWKGAPYNPDNKAAAQELDYTVILLKPGEKYDGGLPLPIKPAAVASDAHGTAATYTEYHLEGVVTAKLVKPRANCGQAYGCAQGEGTGVIDHESLRDITSSAVKKEGVYSVAWEAPGDGSYAVFVYWMHGTGQTASPSVSTNYTINYVDSYGVEALIDYWEETVLTDELRKTVRESGRGEIYMDSLELITYGAGGLFWGHSLKSEFVKRMGFDITPYLPLLTVNGVRVTGSRAKQYDYAAASAEGEALAKKVRDSFYRVLTDLYCENVLKPLDGWLHSLNMTLRAEPSYGMPYEISTPAKYIDGIETESFAQVADLDLYRGMLGSANMYGRVFSSETGAVSGRNYCYSMDDWTQLCLLQFAGGVSRTVFHGYSAIEGSESDTYWPGHEGMYARFSERFNSRQPASEHYGMWTRMLARNQKLLRQGAPMRDIAVLRTDCAFINYGQPKGEHTFADNFFMRDKLHFWNDLSLQRAGYTYDYFSPLLLEDTDNISWTAKELQPNGPAYRALIVYQESIELSSAKALLKIAKGGLPVVFVNNNTELVAYDGTEAAHKRAASVNKYLADSDVELNKVIAELKALPNAAETDSPGGALGVLRKLGVLPRVAFAEPNSKIITISRRDSANSVIYTYAYSYKFELNKGGAPFDFKLCIEGEGVPYRVDAWSGGVEKLALYEHADGRTVVPLTLVPGESVIIALDLAAGCSLHAVATTADKVVEYNGKLCALAANTGKYTTKLSTGEAVVSKIQAPGAISIQLWNIEIEDWNEGERIVNTEEKFGHVTTEVYYTTKKTSLFFENTRAVAWKDLPADGAKLAALAGERPSMAHVSGIGRYSADFVLSLDGVAGARLELGNCGGGTAEVYVNGKKAPGVSTRTLTAEIGELLRDGVNSIRIEVASTLTNRMLQRGYGEKRSAWTDAFPEVQSYGLTGEVRIVPYAAAELK